MRAPKLHVQEPTRRLLRSYGPILAAGAAFVIMAAAVPVAGRERQEYAGSVNVPDVSQSTDGGVTGGTDGTGGTVGGTGGSGGSTGGGGGGGGVQACTDRARQVGGDPYSPPCYAFSGNNGGATSKGVTADVIKVAVRSLDSPSAAELFASISGQSVSDSPESYENTVRALGEYFSKNFQFYGRKIDFQFFRGTGSGTNELLGGGKEAALADATRSSQELGVFADISGITIPYADALAQQGVVNFGSPYPSQKWFADRAPYSWSLFPDGTNVVRSAAASILGRIPAQSITEFGGPSVNGKPRSFAILAPENADYQESAEVFRDILASKNYPVARYLKYKLDINSMTNQASSLVAQMKDAGVTSVICACDPVMLALGLTPKSNEQGFEPEWLTSGLAFVEQDIVGQLIDTRQWSHAFGISYNAESEPQGRNFPYAAFKSVRPDEEPAFGVEEIYYQMYMFAIGVQMAGPDLNPQTFQAGMYAYPGGTGPRGLWGFGPGDHTPTDDYREIWWDPNRISPQNNQAGAWVQLGNGRRYTPDNAPQGPAPYFKEG